MSHLYFIFTLMFSVINYVTSFKQTYLFFVHFWNISYYMDDYMNEESE